MVLFFGANDAAPLPSVQHVDIKHYEENITEIIAFIKQHNSQVKLLLISPPPVLEQQLQEHNLLRSEKATELYAKSCIKVANQLQIPALDLWSVMMQSEHKTKDLLSDGLHLSKLGNALLSQAFMDKISQTWPDLMPAELPNNAPLWDKISK